MKKRFLLLLITVATMISMFGCGKTETKPTEAVVEEITTKPVLKINNKSLEDSLFTPDFVKSLRYR